MRFAAITLAALLYWPIPSHGQTNAPSQDDGQGEKSGPQGGQIAGFTHNADNDQGNADQQKKSAGGESAPDIWITALTAVIAVAAIAQVVTAICQACIYRKQAKLMREAIDQNRKSSEAQLRAYLTVDNQADDAVSIERFREVLDQGAYLLFAENTGQTPAHDVESLSTWTFFPGYPTEWPENVRFKTVEELRKEDSDRGSQTVLGSRHRTAIRCKCKPLGDGTTLDAALKQVAAKTITVYIYGTILYRDVFSDEVRSTEFCTKAFIRKEAKEGINIGFTSYDLHHTAT